MKYLLIVIISVCNLPLACAQSKIEKTLILQGVVGVSEIANLLDLDDKGDRGNFRIVDLTGKFKGMSFDYLPEGWVTPLHGLVIKKCPVDFNTGLYRDFTISQFKKTKDGYQIRLVCSNYKCTSEKKVRLFIEIDFILNEDNFVTTSFKAEDWD